MGVAVSDVHYSTSAAALAIHGFSSHIPAPLVALQPAQATSTTLRYRPRSGFKLLNGVRASFGGGALLFLLCRRM